MQRILIQAQDFDSVQKLKSSIENHLPFEVIASVTARGTQRVLTTHSVNTAILSFQNFSDRELEFIYQLRSVGYDNPVLALADQIPYQEAFNLAQKHRIFLMEKPFKDRALRGLTRKLVISKSVPFQKYPRFEVHQETDVEPFISGGALSSKVYNLSKGGGYCEFRANPSLAIGDLFRLTVNLNEVSKSHKLNAKVVWTTPQGQYSGSPGIGFRFIKDMDVYNELLGDL